MMSLYQQTRKFVDLVSGMPTGPALHTVINNCRAPESSAWLHLRDYAKAYTDFLTMEPLQAVSFPSRTMIKVCYMQNPESLRGVCFLLTESVSQAQRQQLAEIMVRGQTPIDPAAPRPRFGL